MTIKFKPLTKHDTNYAKVIDLFFEAFPKVQRLPSWVVKYRLRNGKAGFYSLYDQDIWVGFIYVKAYKNIIFVKFFAISEQRRSDGYGSKVMDSMKDEYSGQRVILNIEELDNSADNFQQRIKRKAFYEKNGFTSTGYIVKEPAERQEMLIRGGTICKEEIEAMYKHFLGNLLYVILKPEILEI
ncbi:GNAT family N-acetyltransferase [Pseudoalteromonas sp. Of7M-16]|uniref:GNAT family N-acetyltransferase n=1 Tax=Pseudoalteromonas sp. Of7M-16 TaxID=2917756 RepID=UPI001EF57E45|nr:GNAT family N-acetyltransferase [Pseudoalteromonas sp. Of7M-16]MCG7547435.1 GNAT family N-acetyltransferase [Pseudoalteromonas sp. Of7M-16]